MQRNAWACVAIVAAMLVCVSAAAGGGTFDAFPLTRVDVREESFGSQQALMNLLAYPVAPGEPLDGGHRAGAILSLLDVVDRHAQYLEESVGATAEEAQQSFQRHLLGNMGGVVVVVPSAGSLSYEEREAWKSVEDSFAEYSIQVPYYFVHDSEEFQSVHELIKENAAASSSGGLSTVMQLIEGHSYQLISSASQPTRIKGAEGANIQGWLAGAAPSDGGQTPTVLILAHYDHFTLVPGMSEGANDNASGTVALLELARLYHRLYRGAGAAAPYNLLFLLTAGAPLNYQGAQDWLLTVDTRLAKSVEAVISLDELGGDSLQDKVFMHASRPVKDPVAKRLYESFESAAEQYSIDFEVKHYKVDLSDDELPWEHEHFSRDRYLATTVTTKPFPGLAHETSILDTRDTVDVKVLDRNINFVAEALAKFLFNLQSDTMSVFEQFQRDDEKFSAVLLHALATMQRDVGHAEAALVPELERALGSFTADVGVSTFKLDPSYTFFTYTPVTLAAHPVKPFMFDVVLSGVLCSMVASIYFTVKSIDFL